MFLLIQKIITDTITNKANISKNPIKKL